jgi:thioredoxin reductase
MLSTLANGLEDLSRNDLLTALRENGTTMKTDTTVNEIGANNINFSNKDSKNQTLTEDKIILSMGQISNRNKLKESIESQLGIKARYIGDVASVEKILTAVQQGYYASVDVFAE